MRKTKAWQIVHIVTIVLCACLLFSSCRYNVSAEKRVDVISDISV